MRCLNIFINTITNLACATTFKQLLKCESANLRIRIFQNCKIMKRKHPESRKTDSVIAINDDNCARCRSCVRKCPYNVLEMVNDEQGLHLQVVHPEKCTACGACIDVCQFNALQFIRKNNTFDDSDNQYAGNKIEEEYKTELDNEIKMKPFNHFFWRIPFFLTIAAILIAIVMLLWNWLVPAIFGCSAISYWQAAGLFLLSRILFGGWGSFRGRPAFNSHSRMHDKWMKMTDQEREDFINQRRRHFFHGHLYDRQGFDKANGAKYNDERNGEQK